MTVIKRPCFNLTKEEKRKLHMEHFHVALADARQERKALLAASLLAVHPIQGRRHSRLFYAERRAFSPRDPLMPVGFADGVSHSCSTGTTRRVVR